MGERNKRKKCHKPSVHRVLWSKWCHSPTSKLGGPIRKTQISKTIRIPDWTGIQTVKTSLLYKCSGFQDTAWIRSLVLDIFSTENHKKYQKMECYSQFQVTIRISMCDQSSILTSWINRPNPEDQKTEDLNNPHATVFPLSAIFSYLSIWIDSKRIVWDSSVVFMVCLDWLGQMLKKHFLCPIHGNTMH